MSDIENEELQASLEGLRALSADIDQQLRVAHGLETLDRYQQRYGAEPKLTEWYRRHAGLEALGDGLEGIKEALQKTWEWIKRALRALLQSIKNIFKTRAQRLDALGAKTQQLAQAIKKGTGLEDVATTLASNPERSGTLTVEPWMVNLTATESTVTPDKFGRELNALSTTMNSVLQTYLKSLEAITKANNALQREIWEAEQKGSANIAEIEEKALRGLKAGISEASVDLNFRPKLMGAYEFVVPADKTKGPRLVKTGETRVRTVSIEGMQAAMPAISNGINGIMGIFGSKGSSTTFTKKLADAIEDAEMQIDHLDNNGSQLQAKYYRQTLQAYSYFTEEYDNLQKYVYNVMDAGRRYMLAGFKPRSMGNEDLTLDLTVWSKLF